MNERRDQWLGCWDRKETRIHQTRSTFSRFRPVVLAVLIVLHMCSFTESHPQKSHRATQYLNTTSLRERGWGVIQLVSLDRGGDRTGILDRLARQMVVSLGWTVAFQSLATAVTANEHQLLDKVCVGTHELVSLRYLFNGICA